MSNIAQLTTRFARRPLLLEPNAASQILMHLAEHDPRHLRSEGRLEAVLRKIGVGRRPLPLAMEDDDYDSVPPPTQPQAYWPLWAEDRYGEPEDAGYAWTLHRNVALIDVSNALSDEGSEFCGTFYHGYDTLLKAFRSAIADERVKGIFVHWKSPGGVASSGILPLAQFIRDNRAQKGGKPIHMYADLAASAAYWLPVQGDFLSAGAMAYVGSIGAVVVLSNAARALKKQGIAVEAIQFGSKKTDGAWWKPLSPEARAEFQADIDQIGRNFVAGVRAGRPQLTEEVILGTEAAVFMGDHDDPARSALALGLIDAVETEEEAFDRLLARIGEPPFTQPTTATTTKDTPTMFKTKTAKTETAKTTSPKVETPAADTSESDEDEGEDETPQDDVDAEDTEKEIEAADDSDPKASAKSYACDIAASVEGKANPAAALAAIEAGLTLSQFKTMAAVKPEPAAARGGMLREAMAGVKPVGLDAAQPKAASLDSSLVANARARSGR